MLLPLIYGKPRFDAEIYPVNLRTFPFMQFEEGVGLLFFFVRVFVAIFAVKLWFRVFLIRYI